MNRIVRSAGIAMLMGVIVALTLPASLQACPSCYGDVNSSQQAGLNGAIFTLLGLTGLILGGVSLFFWKMLHRSRRTQSGVGTIESHEKEGK